MPEPNTDARIRAVEGAIHRLDTGFIRLVEVNSSLKDLSQHIVQLLTTNRFNGERIGKLTQQNESQDTSIQDLQIKVVKLEQQIAWVFKIFAAINAVSLVILGWYLNKG